MRRKASVVGAFLERPYPWLRTLWLCLTITIPSRVFTFSVRVLDDAGKKNRFGVRFPFSAASRSESKGRALLARGAVRL